MFDRVKIASIFLFVSFTGIVIYHFYNPNWAIKADSKSDSKQGVNKTYIHNFISRKEGNWSEPSKLVQQQQLINNVHPYSSTLVLNLDSIAIEGQKIKISCSGFSKIKNNELYAILSVENNDGKLYYRPFPINIKSNEWFNYRFEDLLPESIPEGNVLKYYIWNKSGHPFLIRQLKLEIN